MNNASKKQHTSHSSTMSMLVIVIVPIVCLIPFVTKAFHIDDTLFLWCAKQINTHPIDFFGFAANWYGHEMPMFQINHNPPLVSYYIALLALFFGYNEVILHLAFLIPAVGLSLGTYYLARLLCPRPQIAALIATLTPVFLVSSTNIMTDTMMVSFYVWAVALWLYGMKDDSSLKLLFASIFIAFSALTKYFGITLLPLLLVYSLVEKRRLGNWALFLCIPVLILVGYEYLTYTLYGHGLLSNTMAFTMRGELTEKTSLLTKTLTGLTFTGGCLITVFFYTPLLWPRRSWAAGGILLLILIVPLLYTKSAGALRMGSADGIRWSLIIQFTIFIVTSVHIVILSFTDLWKHRDAPSLLLFLWVIGTLFFINFVNWTINARIVLPMVPAVAILVARRLSSTVKSSNTYHDWHVLLPLIPATCIALSVTWADVSLANCQRSAARMIYAEFDDYPHTLWFQGHWGFQYYMESLGGKALDFNKSILRKGDIVIIPLNNCFLRRLPKDKFHFVGKRKLTPCRWLGIMSREVGAGFYTLFVKVVVT